MAVRYKVDVTTAERRDYFLIEEIAKVEIEMLSVASWPTKGDLQKHITQGKVIDDLRIQMDSLTNALLYPLKGWANNQRYYTEENTLKLIKRIRYQNQ